MKTSSTQNKALRTFVALLTIALVFWIVGPCLKSSHGQSFYDGTNAVLAQNSGVSISTLASNRQTLGTIGVGTSPFQMTNPLPHTAVLFIGGGVLTGLQINGATIGTGLTLTGITTITLQPGEWATITYTVAPTVRWKPL